MFVITFSTFLICDFVFSNKRQIIISFEKDCIFLQLKHVPNQVLFLEQKLKFKPLYKQVPQIIGYKRNKISVLNRNENQIASSLSETQKNNRVLTTILKI